MEVDVGTEAVGVPGWVGIIGIGALRALRLPIPAPPLYGALMVLGLPGGYLLMNRYLTR